MNLEMSMEELQLLHTELAKLLEEFLCVELQQVYSNLLEKSILMNKNLNRKVFMI